MTALVWDPCGYGDVLEVHCVKQMSGEKPRNDAQIKVEHVDEFVGKQGVMRDDLIQVEPMNIK